MKITKKHFQNPLHAAVLLASDVRLHNTLPVVSQISWLQQGQSAASHVELIRLRLATFLVPNYIQGCGFGPGQAPQSPQTMSGQVPSSGYPHGPMFSGMMPMPSPTDPQYTRFISVYRTLLETLTTSPDEEPVLPSVWEENIAAYSAVVGFVGPNDFFVDFDVDGYLLNAVDSADILTARQTFFMAVLEHFYGMPDEDNAAALYEALRKAPVDVQTAFITLSNTLSSAEFQDSTLMLLQLRMILAFVKMYFASIASSPL